MSVFVLIVCLYPCMFMCLCVANIVRAGSNPVLADRRAKHSQNRRTYYMENVLRLDGEGGSDVEHATPELEEKEEYNDSSQAELPFVPLLIVSALSVAFAHGGNDVANAVGPLAVIVEVYNGHDVTGTPEIHYWELSLGSGGFVIGIMLLGTHSLFCCPCPCLLPVCVSVSVPVFVSV